MPASSKTDTNDSLEMQTARGRLKGALKDLVEQTEETDEDEPKRALPARGRPPKKPRKDTRNYPSFVMKLFDRSVDLARYDEASPLYPICRDWMTNQPNLLRSTPRSKNISAPPRHDVSPDFVEDIRAGRVTEIDSLPGSLKIDVSRIPDLIDEQKSVSKNNIDLDYNNKGNQLLSREDLLAEHHARWVNVRQKWQEQSRKYEEKFQPSLDIIESIGFVMESSKINQ